MSFTPEQYGKLVNGALTMYNAALNQALAPDDAKKHCIEELAQKAAAFDQQFEVDEQDPLRSEKVWEVRMSQFEAMKEVIEAIK